MRRTTLHSYWLCRWGHYSHFKFYLNKKLFRLQLQSYPQAGNSDAVELFIDQTDSVRYINELNKEHEGPLHFASRSHKVVALWVSNKGSQEWGQAYSRAVGQIWSKGKNIKMLWIIGFFASN